MFTFPGLEEHENTQIQYSPTVFQTWPIIFEQTRLLSAAAFHGLKAGAAKQQHVNPFHLDMCVELMMYCVGA